MVRVGTGIVYPALKDYLAYLWLPLSRIAAKALKLSAPLSHEMTKVGSKDWERQIHNRLVRGDKVASAELAEALLDDLVAKLKRRFSGESDHDLLVDAAIEAVMSYVKNPGQFDPDRRSLKGFLVMAADGDYRNLRDKRRRFRVHETGVEDVEESASARNKRIHTLADSDGVGPLSEAIHREDEEAYRRFLNETFVDQVDRQLADLVLSNERSTDRFSEVLGIQDEPIEQQRKIVKNHKDRIKKRLERLRSDSRERE